jgi:hypothetical protein
MLQDVENIPRNWLNRSAMSPPSIRPTRSTATDPLIRDVAARFDLTEREAAVYVASLGARQLPVQRVASLAQSERTGTYDVLARLAERGLIQLDRVGKRSVVTAVSPDVVWSALTKRLAAVEAVLPRLIERYHQAVDNFSIERRVGDAVIAVTAALLERSLGPVRFTLGAVSLADCARDPVERRRLTPLTPLFVQRATRLLVASAFSSATQAWFADLTRSLPARQFPTPTVLDSSQLITHDVVLTVSLEPEGIVGTVVSSPGVVRHAQTTFDLLWRRSKVWSPTGKLGVLREGG